MRWGRVIPVALAVCLCVGAAVWYRTRPPELPIGSDGFHYDPVEDDPSIQPFLREAEKEAKLSQAGTGPRPLGAIHGYWGAKKRILKEKYGIDWRTPAELNPKVAFD